MDSTARAAPSVKPHATRGQKRRTTRAYRRRSMRSVRLPHLRGFRGNGQQGPGRLGSVGDAELPIGGREPELHSVHGEGETQAYLAVRRAGRGETQYLELARREPVDT